MGHVSRHSGAEDPGAIEATAGIQFNRRFEPNRRIGHCEATAETLELEPLKLQLSRHRLELEPLELELSRHRLELEPLELELSHSP